MVYSKNKNAEVRKEWHKIRLEKMIGEPGLRYVRYIKKFGFYEKNHQRILG